MVQSVLIFPHQLFKNIDGLNKNSKIYLIEEFLFFKQYLFHKQKLVFHRASMKFYEFYLKEKGFNVQYIESSDSLSDVRIFLKSLPPKSVIEIIEPNDFLLKKRIQNTCLKHQLTYSILPTQQFLNSENEFEAYFDKKSKYFQTNFYIQQRTKNKILVDDQLQPLHGKWTFDAENRLKYPKNQKPPKIDVLPINSNYQEAIEYVGLHFSNNYGDIQPGFIYPTTFEEAEQFMLDFFQTRFLEFGIYEDAIVKKQKFLNHSVLSCLINSGLLLPLEVINNAISFAEQHQIPMNSLEGFVRQIMGWREFIYGVYKKDGVSQRTKNFWGFERPIPASFYNGTTGILPIDETIKKILKTGYNHHIERLMILSNFMLLCEFHPNSVYQWFMEMYIDAYDWVMVPNVYGMGQFADGGLMCSKPYISGSNYILKMSDYEKNDDWTRIWDALFWRFMHVNRDFFLSNPRLGMLVRTFDKMNLDKRNQLIETADQFLNNLK